MFLLGSIFSTTRNLALRALGLGDLLPGTESPVSASEAETDPLRLSPRAGKILHDSILEGVKGDDAEPASRVQETRALAEKVSQIIEFVIDREAESLEGAGGRMDALMRNRAFDHRDQLPGCADRGSLPLQTMFRAMGRARRSSPYSLRMGDPPGKDPVKSSRAVFPVLIHAHVQRGIPAEAETPFRAFQLLGGNAQVQQDPVHRVNGKGLQNLF